MKRFRNTNYFVSEDGRVFRNGRELKQNICPKGYKRISLWIDNKRFTRRVHRLVAECYIPNPENKPQVNHKDGNKINNNISNLEWVTNEENKDHAVENDLYPKGEEKKTSILTEEQVMWVRQNHIPKDKKYGMRALSRRFNVSSSTIFNIIHQLKWKHIPLEPQPPVEE